MSSPRPLGPLPTTCTPHSTLNRVRIYMTSQSIPMFLLPRLGSTSCSETRHLEASLLLFSPPPAETFFKNYRRQLVYPRALVLGTQADGTEISSSADTEVPNAISSKQPELSPSQPSMGSSALSPFLGHCSQRLRERAQGPGVSGRGEKWRVIRCHCRGQRWLLTISVKISLTLSFHSARLVLGRCPAWGVEISQSPCIQVGPGTFILASDVWVKTMWTSLG